MPDAGLAVVILAASIGWLLAPPEGEARLHGLGGRDTGRTTWRQRARAGGRWLAGRVGMGPASRRQRARGRVRVIQALGGLAAELEAGQPPREALRRTGGDPAVWPRALAAVSLDGDVPAGLVEDARAAPVLLQLAACWRVAADSGAALAPAITRLAQSARAAEEVRVDLEAQLAGPRATARMLALLPAVGIGFGLMLGSDPISWLLGTSAGWLCLGAGLALTSLGMWWTGRIAAGVERLL